MRRVMLSSALALALSPPYPMPAQSVESGPSAAPIAVQTETPSTQIDAPASSIAPTPSKVTPTPQPCSAAPPQSGSSSAGVDQTGKPCPAPPNPFKRFLNTTTPVPLTPEKKARLAFHNMKDPGNLLTIVGTAGYTIGTDAHTAYGPGWKGFGRNTGYSLLQDTTGQFFGVFLVPSIFHQDPHYHREPHATFARRVGHAIIRTVIAQSDYGATMPNYANLLTNPICAEISNLYVPGINGNAPSTAIRIATGYATDPVDNLITEFLPDVASRVHVHVIFVQRILNRIATGQSTSP